MEPRRERVESNDSASAGDEAAGAAEQCVGQGSSTQAEHYTEMVVDP
jgi:hypothetical protein